MKRVIIGALTFSLTLAGISTASAHTVLIFSNPSKGATVRVLPAKITLKFAEPLLTLGKRAINKVVVTNPENFLVTTGDFHKRSHPYRPVDEHHTSNRHL